MKRPLTTLTLLIVALLALSLPAAGQGHERVFKAPLSGAEEVPPNDSTATGQAIFKLSRDGQTLEYRLITAKIENVTQVHIHLAPAGANGPVVAWLYPDGPPPELISGRSNGVLATGTITADDLVGLLVDADLEELVDAMRDGDAYVNVHTSQFPAGEIRGQIR